MKSLKLLSALILFTAGIAYTDTFSSIYTDLNDSTCKWVSDGENGSDGAQECSGIDDYYISEYYSAAVTIRAVQHRKDGNYRCILLPDTTYSRNELGQKLEWRYSGRIPFAVIHRINCFDEADKAIGSFLVIRGLKGYEEISGQVNASKIIDANKIARQIADSIFIRIQKH